MSTQHLLWIMIVTRYMHGMNGLRMVRCTFSALLIWKAFSHYVAMCDELYLLLSTDICAVNQCSIVIMCIVIMNMGLQTCNLTAVFGSTQNFVFITNFKSNIIWLLYFLLPGNSNLLCCITFPLVKLITAQHLSPCYVRL